MSTEIHAWEFFPWLRRERARRGPARDPFYGDLCLMLAWEARQCLRQRRTPAGRVLRPGEEAREHAKQLGRGAVWAGSRARWAWPGRSLHVCR